MICPIVARVLWLFRTRRPKRGVGDDHFPASVYQVLSSSSCSESISIGSGSSRVIVVVVVVVVEVVY